MAAFHPGGPPPAICGWALAEAASMNANAARTPDLFNRFIIFFVLANSARAYRAKRFAPARNPAPVGRGRTSLARPPCRVRFARFPKAPHPVPLPIGWGE